MTRGRRAPTGHCSRVSAMMTRPGTRCPERSRPGGVSAPARRSPGPLPTGVSTGQPPPAGDYDLPSRTDSTPRRSRAGSAAGEAGLRPDPRVHEVLDRGDVFIGSGRVPAARVPAPHAAPDVSGVVRPAGGPVAQPDLIAVVAGPPDGVRDIDVHRGRCVKRRPGCLHEPVFVLHDAVALRAFAGPAVGSEAMSRRAEAGIGRPVTEVSLLPPALDSGLREDNVLADAPLARCPAQDLLRRAGEITIDPESKVLHLGAVARREDV